MNFFKNNWPYLTIIVIAFFLRFYRLSQIPSALYYDEIDLGYQIRSYQQTGKDYRGELSPFYASSFNTDKTPLPIWFSLVFSNLSSSPEVQVRAGTAIAGVLVTVLAMGIASFLFSNFSTTIVTGLVFAASPWLIHFSRLAFEAQFALLALFSFLYFFLSWHKTNKVNHLYFSALALGLSVYTYRTMSLLAPLLGFTTFVLFYKQILALGFRKIIIAFTLFAVLYLPFMYATTIGAKDQTRISQISIFSDPKIAIEVQRSRELVSGNFADSTLGQSASFQSKVFHNKALSFVDRFASNTLNNFSANFLFLIGDGNGRHSAKNTGQLLLTDFFGLVAGFYFLFGLLKDKKIVLLISSLILGAIPANLTLDGANHASRLITFAGPLLLIIGFGYGEILKVLQKIKLGSLASLALVFSWAFFFARFLNTYFYHFPIINAREFGYGYKQAILKVENLKNDFDKIYLSGVNDPPMLYYFFWSNTHPKKVQDYGSEYGDNIIKNIELDKVKPFHPTDLLCKEKEIEKLDPKIIYMVDYRNLPLDFRSSDKDKVPQGIKLIETIKYPDNEVAYYLITRDTKDGKAIAPLKGQSCK